MANPKSDDVTEVPKTSALVVIDVINHFDFPGGDRLLKNSLPIAPRIASLKQQVRRAKMPTIYVNDNFGQWRSNFTKLLDHCLREGAPGRKFVEPLQPDSEDYVVLKPMHSAFYQTPLDTLLKQLKINSLILTGIATNSCVLCSAHDANMRDLQIFVPSDCTAAMSPREHREAIKHIEAIGNASTAPSTFLRLPKR